MKANTKVAICIVNLNCLQHTKNLIVDLDRQSFTDYEVLFYDQNSNESGTKEFIEKLYYRRNYTIIRNNDNIPLNYIWNDFASRKQDTEILTFLNNDIRITSNYLLDTVNVLTNDKRIGIAVHATNNKTYSTATSPTRHIMDSQNVKQGWEFSIRADDWVKIPKELKFYCGDDFIFETNYANNKKVGVITSSPVIHKVSKTREAMGEEFTKKIKEQALEDIENYKKLGYQHKWNNIPKYSRLTQELKTITEISTETNLCNFLQYSNRLKEHLNDTKSVTGNILDVGVNDANTFNMLLDFAIENDKQLVGIDAVEFFSSDIINRGGRNTRPSDNIVNNKKYDDKKDSFTLMRTGLLNDISDIENKVSFVFMGIFSPHKLSYILPKIWSLIETGGTIFFPYYYNSSEEIQKTIENFFADKMGDVIFSRPQTRPGMKDMYMAVKCHKKSIPFIKIQKPLIVASVLKTGGRIYNEEYVNKLASSIKRNLNKKYEFVCLTDSASEEINKDLVNVIPLEYNLDGWWSKMELFRPELFSDNQILYIDLDTLIVDNIDDIASYGGEFMGLRDFNTLTHLGSGIMGWQSNKTAHIFYKFITGMISKEIDITRITDGDQKVIEMLVDLNIEWFQDLFPNKMAAFKYQCYDSDTGEIQIPEESSIICFHGPPKISELVTNDIVQKYWK